MIYLAYYSLDVFLVITYDFSDCNFFLYLIIVENRISAHAARLIANCIVAYNSMILNSVYERTLVREVSQEIIDEFIRISPIAWCHTLLTGRYNFKKNHGELDVEAMSLILESHVKQHFWNENNT